MSVSIGPGCHNAASTGVAGQSPGALVVGEATIGTPAKIDELHIGPRVLVFNHLPICCHILLLAGMQQGWSGHQAWLFAWPQFYRRT